MVNAKIICVLILLVLVASQEYYKKVIPNIDPNAKCLDGSPPALYIHQGSQPQNILILLDGGGSCFEATQTKSLEACAKRSKTDFGSSLSWPETTSGQGKGILNLNEENKFKEWTTIFIRYCDGTTFQGNNKNPVEVNGTKLFFRGAVNMRANLKWIDQQYSFDKAKKIVFSGYSAGGIGVYLWADYFKAQLTDPSKFYAIVDSGIFLDPNSLLKVGQQALNIVPLFFPGALSSSQSGGAVSLSASASAQTFAVTSASVQSFMQITNADERPPNTNCLNTLNGKDADWQCLFAPKAMKNLQTKMLWIDSQYDSFMIKNVFGLGCLSQGSSQFTLKKCTPPELLIMNLYRGLVAAHVLTDLIKEGHSVWSIACSWHVSLFYDSVYDQSLQRVPFYRKRLTVKDTVETFVFKDQRIVAVDKYTWPFNRACAF